MSGPGCADLAPSAIAISGSRDTFRVGFEQLEVQSLPGASAGAAECTVSVVLDGADGIAYAPAGLSLAVVTSGPATVSTTGSWTSAPERVSEDLATFPPTGRHLTGALDDETLWSSCSGERELRFTLKASLDEERGSVAVTRVGDLRFHARSCATDGVEPADAAGARPEADAPDAGPASLQDAQVGAPVTDDGGAPPEPSATARVTGVVAAGSGCAAGSVVVTNAAGADSFDVDFTRFTAETTAERLRRGTDCTLNVQLAVPAGKAVAVEEVTLRGSATLGADASAKLTVYTNYLGAVGTSAYKSADLTGPRDGPFEATLRFVGAEQLFDACGSSRSLNLNASVNVRAARAADAARVSLEGLSKVRFVLRSCE